MPTDLHHRFSRLSDVTMHHVCCGPEDGAPVLLLHGWPETWYEWRHLMPTLAAAGYRAIAPDMRGLGDTSRPLDGYDAASVAGDLAELVGDVYGAKKLHLVGHDWGGPVAFALAAHMTKAVASFTIIDVTVPGLGPDVSQGGKRWHHAFHMTPDLPEALITGRERAYLTWFYREFSWQPDAFSQTDIDEYVRCYAQPGALRAGFGYYRNIPANVVANRAQRDDGFRLEAPVLAVGGARTEARGRASEPAESLREVAGDVTEVVVPDSGHFVPEEQPDALAEHLLAHLARSPI